MAHSIGSDAWQEYLRREQMMDRTRTVRPCDDNLNKSAASINPYAGAKAFFTHGSAHPLYNDSSRLRRVLAPHTQDPLRTPSHRARVLAVRANLEKAPLLTEVERFRTNRETGRRRHGEILRDAQARGNAGYGNVTMALSQYGEDEWGPASPVWSGSAESALAPTPRRGHSTPAKFREDCMSGGSSSGTRQFDYGVTTPLY
eukprot:NODE_16517_length_990_cov_4.622248.p1 GENE.NODE_16517_length_990_cov_4.622248~~NODE_16517_length_990_cov_4.622248.p1  ORF type:complete len:201 (-),score=50.01 NODE_16517_length_990_cov_4.622248:286-888(-)